MDILESVLLEVKGGKTSFQPRDGSDAAMEDFQPVASALVHAKNRRLIGGGLGQMDSNAGIRQYCLFIVSQGLTYEGEQYLKEREREIKHNGESVNVAKSALIDNLRGLVREGIDLVRESNYSPGVLTIWSRGVRREIETIFGGSQEIVHGLATESLRSNDEARRLLETYLPRVKRFVAALEDLPRSTLAGPRGHRVFIGHGRSDAWLRLKDYLQGRLNLPCVEFNSNSTAGIYTADRLNEMLCEATFAFLVMTGEDEHTDSTRHARSNVIHEAGLFQGRLGTKRAIILREEGCATFSNIVGLTDIGFREGKIEDAFEEIDGALRREGLID